MEISQPYLSIQDPAGQRYARILRCGLLICALGPFSAFGSNPPSEGHDAPPPPGEDASQAHPSEAADAHTAAPHAPAHGAEDPHASPASSGTDDWVIPEGATPVNPISAGTPTFAHFPPELFGGAHTFDGVAQTSDGRIYVIADHRLLVGTGEHWQAVPGLPEEVNRLYLTRDERLYLSFKHDFGFTDPNKPEGSNWQSIAVLLPSEWSEDALWKPVFEDAAGYVYFVGGPHVVAHHPEKAMRLWRDVGRVDHVFSLSGKIHVMTDQRAIYRLEANGVAEPVMRDIPPNFADIRASVSFDPHTQLFAAGAAGLITFDGKRFAPLHLRGIEGSKFVPDQLLRLKNDRYLALDSAHGLIVFRTDGTVLRQMNQFGDLKARIAQAATVDNEGWIWLAHTSGLYRINPNSPQTSFDYHQGLEGRVLCMAEHEGHFYVGTDDGLFTWENPDARQPGHFIIVPEVPAARSLVSTPHGLAVGSDRGLWVVDGRGPYLVEGSRYPLLLQSPGAPEVLLAPTDRGIRSFVHNGSRWVPDPNAAKLPTSGLEIAIGPQGDLWGEYGPGRLAHYAFEDGKAKPNIFSPREGLPLFTIAPLKRGDEMLFEGGDTVFRYLPERHRFMRSEGWQTQTHAVGHIPTAKALIGPDQTLWVPTSELGREYIAFPPAHFDYAWPDLLRFGEDPITAVYTDSIGYLWVGNGRGLQRLRPQERASRHSAQRQTLVHRVTTEHPGQPLVASTVGVSSADLGTFGSAQRLLRFEYSLLDFSHPGGTRYATFLEGFDHDWQPFAPEAARTVTALPPGDYTLHIKARNRHGEEGTPATITFSIPQPAHQTWWARSLFGLGALAAFGLLVHLTQRKHAVEAKKLRGMLEEKEALITEQELELKTRQGQLKSAVNRADELSEHTDQLIHHRARFEADLNRALRPTMASLAQLGRLLGQETLGETASRLVDGLRKAGEQLVGSVRERLDLRQIEIDHLPIEDVPFNLRDPIERAFAALAPLAKAKRVELIYSLEPGLATLRTGDAQRVEQILSPLLANAIERSSTGEVVVQVKPQGSDSPNELAFTVIDRGNSLSEEARKALLAQSDPQNPPRYRGEPQGLAIARHLLEALGGAFDLVSIPNEGTQASIHLSLPVDPESKIFIPPEFAEKRVLIIDDHPATRNGLQMLAEAHKLHTRLASDGPQALAALQEELPADLIWIDAQLGKTPGHEVLAQIRAEPAGADLPAIVLAPFDLSPELLELARDPRTLVLDKLAFHGVLTAASVALLTRAESAAPPETPEPIEVPDHEDASEEEEDELDAKIRAALAKSNVDQANQAQDPVAAPPKSTKPASPLKILIVDAHPVRPKTTLALLQELGYRAEITQTLNEATAAIEAADRDLVLLADPLDGTSLAAVVSQLKRAVQGSISPIFVALSSGLDPATRQAGLHEDLRTPLDPIALQRLLQMVTPSEEPTAVTV